MLAKAKIDIGCKEFVVGLSFIMILQVYSFSDIYFKQFTFECLQHIKNSRRLHKRKEEKAHLFFQIP